MQRMKLLWKKAEKILKKAKNIYLFTHLSMDGDAIGSLAAMILAMRQLGYENAIAVLGEEPTDVLSYLAMPEEMRIMASPDVKPTEDDVAVLLDCANIGRLSDENIRIANACGKKIKIDHHLPCDGSDFADVDLSDDRWAATCEGLCSIFKAAGVTCDYEIAIRLYAGILTDSGRFTYSCTTPDTLRAVADLIEVTGTNLRWVSERHYDKKKFTTLKLHGVAFENMKLSLDDSLVTCVVSKDDFKNANADINQSGAIVSELLNVSTAKASLFIRPATLEPEDNDYRLSMRCREPYDVGSVCRLFGGGGHKCASGASIEGKTPDEVIEIVTEELKKQFENV